MSATQVLAPIAVQLVADKDRPLFLPTLFGRRLIRGEDLVYSWLDALTEDYSGGYWNFYSLDNGGFYMAPAAPKRMRLAVGGNGFSGEMSAEAAGVVATLFALGQLAAESQISDETDDLIDKYYLLRDFAAGHPESGVIFKAID